jgi:DnaJ-domain-containing protein 1
MKRELLKKYHPHLYSGKGERAVEEATIKSQRINQAYETIMKMKN